MKRNIKNITYSILALFFMLTACDNVDFGNTNVNPNGAGDPNTSSLFAGAINRYSTLGGRNYLNIPTLYVQYQSQVTYTDESRYNEAAINWTGYYVQTLSNLQLIIDICSDEANQTPLLLSQGSIANQIATAMLMKAVIFKRLTDTYGDIPFTEALDPTNLTPNYTSQADLYPALIDMVKEARDMIELDETAPTGDIIYNGDLASWQKLANSLILQMSLQLSKKFPDPSGYAATEFNSALTNEFGVIESVGDDAWFTYSTDLANFNNPWSGNRRPDYFLSAEFVSALKGQGTTSNTMMDARIQAYSTDPSLEGVPYGYEDESGAGRAQMSGLIWTEDAPLPMLTAAYTYLNRADAANLGWTSESVSEMLTKGIQLSYETIDSHWGTSISGSADAYAAARVADIAVYGADQVIAEEKWVALFPQGFDAWAEWRRTEYPVLAPATDYLNNGEIPRRYVYPLSEQTLNTDAYNSGLNSLVPATDNNSSKVWWDQ